VNVIDCENAGLTATVTSVQLVLGEIVAPGGLEDAPAVPVAALSPLLVYEPFWTVPPVIASVEALVAYRPTTWSFAELGVMLAGVTGEAVPLVLFAATPSNGVVESTPV
jgi:hypothetical protein